MNKTEPRVSIGMPVYNGENFIRDALDSLLAQTYKDFELIISDNASTDLTEEICQKYAIKDQRIRYYRNKENIGPTRNYNQAFELSRGEYFKWAAHDDVCAPRFLERCVEALDQNPSVVLSHPKTTIIDESGKFVRNQDDVRSAEELKPLDRYRSIIYECECYQVFGLIRSSILKKTDLIEPYAHGDGVLLAKLALLGRFIEIDEHLFFNREHPKMSTVIAKNKNHLYTAWFDPAKKGKVTFPYWRISKEYYGAITSEASLDWQEKLWCYWHLAIWLRTRSHYLFNDLLRLLK